MVLPNQHATAASIAAWGAWIGTVWHLRKELPDWPVRQAIYRARISMGNGVLEHQLLRLMVWVGATLEHGETAPAEGLPTSYIQAKSGWCNQQCEVFGFLVYHLLGLPSRVVSMRHTDGVNGHTLQEVYYDGKYHAFDVDPDHQAVYRENIDTPILSYEELSANPKIITKEGHWWKSPINNEGRKGFFSSSNVAYTNYCGTPRWEWPWTDKPLEK